MRMSEAEAIIQGESKGFMVCFEWAAEGLLKSDYFPDKHAGESLIETEDEAWRMAVKFAEQTKGRAVNLCVTDHNFNRVDGYKEKLIKNR